jgi:hypothetical protein
MHSQEIFRSERLARVGLGAVFVDVLFDQTLLVYDPRLLGHDRLLGSFPGNCALSVKIV